MKNTNSDIAPKPVKPRALQRQFSYGDLIWLDFTHPTSEELYYLKQRFDFHPLHLEDVRSRIQRPKIDDHADPEYVFLVLHFPVFNEQTRLSITGEVDIFVSRNFVVTTHDTRLRPLVDLLQTAENEKVRAQLMNRGSGFLLYRIIDTIEQSCFPMLYKLDEKLDVLEEGIFERDLQDTVQELSYLRRDVISMRRIIRPNMVVMRSLEARERPYLHLDEDVYFGDLVDGLARIWDMLEEHKEIVEGLDATVFSLASHRINREMKVFTLISIIFLPMTLIASIGGMNFHLPAQDEPLAFWGIMLSMSIIAGAMFWIFRRKRWI